MDACECERDNSSNMLQALHFINGKSIQGRVQNADGRAAQLARQKLTDEQLVTELYLWSVARHPNVEEATRQPGVPEELRRPPRGRMPGYPVGFAQ